MLGIIGLVFLAVFIGISLALWIRFLIIVFRGGDLLLGVFLVSASLGIIGAILLGIELQKS